MVVHLGVDGIDRVTQWATLPDLVFWNPFLYFLNHPKIRSVWIETDDQEGSVYSSDGESDPADVVTVVQADDPAGLPTPTKSSTGRSVAAASAASGSVHPINIALILRRDEYDYETALEIRLYQVRVLDSGVFGRRREWAFRDTLHGR